MDFRPFLCRMNNHAIMTTSRKTFVLFILCILIKFPLLAQKKPLIEEIDKFIKTEFYRSKIPGLIVTVVQHDSILFSKGYGVTSDKVPVDGNTPFAIASLSKAFTAMAVMQLAEAKKIDLDTPLVHYLPSFKVNDQRGSKITVRQLLNQTSGLSDIVFPEMKFHQQPNSLKEAIDRLKESKLANDPGTQYNYHNPNYQILALLVESVSDEKYSEYIYNHILTPLEMDQTFNFINTNQFFSKNRGALTPGHVFLFGSAIRMNEPEWFIEGDAGMVSTGNDLAHWLIVNLNKGKYKKKELLGNSYLQEMFTHPQSLNSSYGMGWNELAKDYLYHSGILWTYYSEQTLLLDKDYGIVILFNSGLNAFHDYNSFTRGIIDILNNQKPENTIISSRAYGILIIILIIISLALGIKKVTNFKKWREKNNNLSRLQFWYRITVRLIPFLFLISIPYLISLTGRVLSIERIVLLMPDIVICLTVLVLLNIMTIIIYFVWLWPKNK